MKVSSSFRHGKAADQAGLAGSRHVLGPAAGQKRRAPPRRAARHVALSLVALAAALGLGEPLGIAGEAPRATAPTSTARPTATPQPAAPEPKQLSIPVQTVRLANGLRVVLNEDHSAPTVAVCVTYDVGARNEQPGRSGFAHLFEHMMFQGSRNVGKQDHFLFISSRGGEMNGTTSSDRTNYFELVPSNALATVLWLEADRMKTLAVTQENFENQRKVVQEEYRMRVSNAAYAEGLIRLKQLAYQGYWPYEHDAIGSMEDLDAAELEWIREFHRTYYAPNNAVLAISGDFQPAQAIALVHRFFDDAEPSQLPTYAPEPAPTPVGRSAELFDHNAKTPGIYLGWRIPPFRTPEHYALELAGLILTYGDSSVLHQKLVQQTNRLRDIASWTYDHRGPDLFVIRALLGEDTEVPVVREVIRDELARLAKTGPSSEELNRAKQMLQSFFLFGLEGNLARSTQLANYELFWGDAALLNGELGNYFRISADQVRDAVAKHLGDEVSTRVVVRPVPPEPSPSASLVSSKESSQP